MTSWPVLESLLPPDRMRVLQAGRRRRFRKGEVIFHYGDPADSLHLLDTGRVTVRILTHRGEQAILAVLGPGNVFGELALVDSLAKRTATVTALEATETISITRLQFEQLLQQHPQVGSFLLKSLAEQVSRLSEHLLEALYSPVTRRVCRRLVVLQHEFGADPISITQDDLALMAGTTRATVNEILQDLARTGVVSIGRTRIRILDQGRLTQRAN